jgi:hypothetical protein
MLGAMMEKIRGERQMQMQEKACSREALRQPWKNRVAAGAARFWGLGKAAFQEARLAVFCKAGAWRGSVESLLEKSMAGFYGI